MATPIDPQYRKNVYNALKTKVEGFNKTEEEFYTSLEDSQYRKNVYNALKTKVDGFSKSEQEFENLVFTQKKKDISTSQNQKLASEPKNGSSATQERDLMIQMGDAYMKEQNTPEAIKSREDKTNKTVEQNTTSLAIQKLSKPQFGPLSQDDLEALKIDRDEREFARFEKARTVTPEEIESERLKIEQEANNESLWNKTKTFVKNWWNDVFSDETAVQVDTDPLAEKKKLADKYIEEQKAEAKANKRPEPVYTPEERDNLAKRLELNERVNRIKESKERDYLRQAQNTAYGDKETLKDRLLVINDNKHIQEISKFAELSSKDYILENELNASTEELFKLSDTIRGYAERGEQVPEDVALLYNQTLDKAQNVFKDLEQTKLQVAESQAKLDDFEHNLDSFKRDYGYLSNLSHRIGSSVVRIGSGFANLAESVLDVQNELGEKIGIFNPQALVGKQYLAEKRRGYEILKDMEEDDFMKSLSVDDIKSPSDFMSWLLNDVAGEQAINLVMASTGAPGILAIGTSASGQKRGEMVAEMESGDREYDLTQQILGPLAFGASETVGAMVDRMAVGRIKSVLKSATPSGRKLMAESAWANLAKNTSKNLRDELTEETGVHIFQQFIDKYLLDNPNIVNITDGTKDVVAVTTALTAMLGAGGAVGVAVQEATKSFSYDNQIDKANREILRLERELDKSTLTEQERKLLSDNLEKAKSKADGLVRSVISNIGNLTNEEFQEVLQLEKAQTNIRDNAKEISSSTNLSDDVKKQLLSNLEDELKANDSRRVEILKSTSENTTTDSIETRVENEVEETTKPNKVEYRGKTYNIDDRGNVTKEDGSFADLTLEELNEIKNQNETAQGENTETDGDFRPRVEGVDEITNETQPENQGIDNNESVGEEVVESTTEPRASETTTEIRLSEKSEPYTVTFNKGILDIRNKKGETPSKQTQRKVYDKWAESFDFTQGEVAPEVNQADLNPNRHVAENSNNPAEVAQALINMDNDALFNEQVSHKDRVIAENIGKVKRRSFIENSDANHITMGLAKSYFNNNGSTLDVLAQEMSEIAGVEITEQDIVDFMLENPNGPASIFSKAKRDSRLPLENRFIELTGLPASDKHLKMAVEQLASKDAEVNEYSTALDFMSDEELLTLQNQIEQYEQENTAITGTASESEITNSQENAGESENQGESVSDNRTEEAGQTGIESITDTEQASTQDRTNSLVTERIKPVRRTPNNPPKKLNQIIADVAKGLKSTLIYGRSRRRRSLGTYNPSNTLVRISRAGDIDTVAHELGHLLDDRFDILGTIPQNKVSQIESQLEWFSERGGSNPPKNATPQKQKEYLQREGLAEFIRAYLVNPTQAKAVAPELFEHFENSIDENTKNVLEQFSNDYIDFANASYGEQIISNIETSNLPNKKGFREWIERFKDKDGKFHITPFDNLNSILFSSLGIPNKAFKFAIKLSGKNNLLPEENFEVLSRVFAGVNGKINRILSNGLINAKNKVLKDKNGNPMTVNWLMELLDTSSKKTLEQDIEDVIKLLVAERTIEYSQKFNRIDNLTGIGGGVNTDLEVAVGFIEEFEKLKTTNKEKYDRIRESAERYREYADAGLRYAVEKGRLSEESYDKIKENNQLYVALTRVNEINPGEELDLENLATGGIASVKDVFKKAKGGTKFIQNPYLSLIENTVNIIKESDRNEVLRTFIEPLNKLRQMGDGTPIDFAQIARPASTGDKNVKTIFVDGIPQRWQFDQQIFEGLTSVESGSSALADNIMKQLASMIKFTITNFPVFALRNATRDTTARLLLSRTKSGLKEFIQNSTDRELFELYGGSQGGYYLLSKDSYRQKLEDTTRELTKKGGIVLNPRSLAKGYRRLLENSENLNRIAEFKAAYKKAKSEGLDDYNARLYAAYQARDLMDFAVAGHMIRTLNQYIPFLNAGVQGLVRTKKAIQEDPTGYMTRQALYMLAPQLAIYAYNVLNGDDEEYEELPAYQRDLYWNFKTPFTGDAWISIPKPFEQSIPSAIVDRAISKVRGNDKAFEGLSGSISSTMIPVDEGSLLGSIKPIWEAISNKDLFRDTNIVPGYEEGKLLELRKGTSKASRLGNITSDAFKEVGWELDPRYVDHVVKGYTGYIGDWGLTLSNIGVDEKDNRYRIGVSKTGFARDVPVSNSMSVKAVYKLADELGKWNSRDIKRLRGKIEDFYEAETTEERSKISKEIYKNAKEIRLKFEKEKQEIKKATN